MARALRVSATDGSFALEEVAPDLLGPIDFAANEPSTTTILGSGPLAGSSVPGSNRLVVCGVSPLWGGLFPSTIGGAGLPWARLGARFVAISGRAEAPSVLVISSVAGRTRVAVEPIDVETVWRGHDGELGVHALLRAAYARYQGRLPVGRVLAVGPAAAVTRAGAIASAPITGEGVTSVDTWAGRGGLGSRLFQTHGIAAIVFGGDRHDPETLDRALVDRLTAEHYGTTLRELDLAKTTKYRFDPGFKTGGTFGSNYHGQRERALSFNYRSVLLPDEERTGIFDRLIGGHYLAQFDDEISRRQTGKTCGEPCSAICKKLDGKFKKDYQPYQAMGPLIGVFDQRAAERINRFADACGFDAIEIGGTIAWTMERLASGWLAPSEIGVAEGPRWDASRLEPVADSAHNAALGRRIIEWLLADPRAAALRRGLRAGAREAGGPAAQAAVYNARGKGGDGSMVPNQYWVPGMFAPMPIMGRYYLDYSYEWQPPRELGRSSGERMVREIMLDNFGTCRFHRAWAETLLPDLVTAALGQRVDADAHHRALSRRLQAGGRPQPFATQRVVDIVHTYLRKVHDDGPRDAELDGWLDRFERDQPGAARAYWEEIRGGVEEVLGQPTPTPRA